MDEHIWNILSDEELALVMGAGGGVNCLPQSVRRQVLRVERARGLVRREHERVLIGRELGRKKELNG